MPSRSKNLGKDVQDRLFATADQAVGVYWNNGLYCESFLAAPANIVANERVTITATNVFQCKAITVDSGCVCTLPSASAGDVSTLTASGDMTWSAGHLLRIGDEIVKIVVTLSAREAVVARGRCGTSIAAHTAASIYQASSYTDGWVPFGVNTDLTPAVWLASLAAEINNAPAGGSRIKSMASTIYDPGDSFADEQRSRKIVAVVAPGNAGLLIRSAIPEYQGIGLSENLSGSGNAWSASSMVAGQAPRPARIHVVSASPKSNETGIGSLFRLVPFTPRIVRIDVYVAATGVRKAWDGGFTVTAQSDGWSVIKVDNSGSVDWDTNDNVIIEAIE